MTDKLKTLLHERAAAVDFETPDLDAITRAGGRRVHRRRTLAVTGAAGVLALAIAAPFVAGGHGDGPARDDSSRVATSSGPTFPRGPLIWAEGEVIHYGDRTIDAGRPVEAFVHTAYGFVLASDGVVYEADGTDVRQIGLVDRAHPRLVGDEDGRLAGWVQRGGDPSFVIQDLAADVTSVEAIDQPADPDALADGENPAYFYDIDGGTAYWRDGRGAVAFDVATGGTEVVDADALNGFDLIDVQNGQIAFYGDDGVEIGATRAGARPLAGALESGGQLSPSAGSYAPDAENLRVLDVAGGGDISPTLDGYYFSTAYAWLGDDTVAVIAQQTRTTSVELLTCTLSGGSCEVTVSGLGSFDDLIAAGFAFPNGERLDS